MEARVVSDPLDALRESETLKPELEALETVLAQHGENELAQMIRRALDGSDKDLRLFLASNELWGGAGSIADQAGVGLGRHVRRQVEEALVKLGARQMQEGVVNARTGMWVEVFLKWRSEGI
jgi:hypothetical protein